MNMRFVYKVLDVPLFNISIFGGKFGIRDGSSHTIGLIFQFVAGSYHINFLQYFTRGKSYGFFC